MADVERLACGEAFVEARCALHEAHELLGHGRVEALHAPRLAVEVRHVAIRHTQPLGRVAARHRDGVEHGRKIGDI